MQNTNQAVSLDQFRASYYQRRIAELSVQFETERLNLVVQNQLLAQRVKELEALTNDEPAEEIPDEGLGEKVSDEDN